jgi:glutaredoxin
MIKIFSTENCSHCKDFIQQLKDRGIDYEFKDVDNNYETVVDIAERIGNTELPIVVLDNGKELSRPNIEDIK